VPVDAWLRGPLRDWAESLLDPRAMRDEGVLDPTAVRNAWEGFLGGRGASGLAMWTVLMLRAWSAEWRASA
jgi:asparagine synthase (glutamine-hydrolysing)